MNLPRNHWYTSPYAAQDWSDFHPLRGHTFGYKLKFILACIGRVVLGLVLLMLAALVLLFL